MATDHVQDGIAGSCVVPAILRAAFFLHYQCAFAGLFVTLIPNENIASVSFFRGFFTAL
jgi:hypothetical protein